MKIEINCKINSIKNVLFCVVSKLKRKVSNRYDKGLKESVNTE